MGANIKIVQTGYSLNYYTDGTYNLNLTLYFSKQAYVNISLVISGLTLIFSIAYLLFDFGRKLYEKTLGWSATWVQDT